MVHGAWGGGWRWQPTARMLRAAGHEVFVATLTGLGERLHLGHPDVDLDLHILDVVNLLAAEDLSNIVLAGHSYGGMVVTGVAERVPERIAQLVYLDAFVPHDGDSLLDLVEPDARLALEAELTHSLDGWRIHVPTDTRPRPRPAPSPRDTPQPWKTFTQKLPVTNPAAVAIPRLYVRATADKQPGLFMTQSFVKSYARVQAEGWPIREVDAGHREMSESEETIAILAGLANLSETHPSVASVV